MTAHNAKAMCMSGAIFAASAAVQNGAQFATFVLALLGGVLYVLVIGGRNE